MISSLIQKIKSAPSVPGVYLFYRGKKPIYVGKAINLKNRLASYLKPDGFKLDLIQKEANDLKWRRLSSGVEALIVESQLIKKLKPRYNILMRDDKSYFYAAFTRPNFQKKISGGQAREKFPRIFVTHKRPFRNCLLLGDVPQGQKLPARRGLSEGGEIGNYEAIGPFTEGQSLKIVLKTLRRYFPYCTCSKPHRRICLNAQIENCPGFCCQIGAEPNEKAIRQYQKNIKAIKDFLTGKKKFNRYPEISEKIKAFENILAHREFLETNRNQKPTNDKIAFKRVEGYDISHLSGKESVGAMTVFIKKAGVWQPEKSQWRKFKIKTAGPSDDPAAIAEIVGRRLRHPEWPYPDLIIIDGGIAQLNAAKRTISQLKAKSYKLKAIKVIGFAKPRKFVHGLKKTPQKLDELPSELAKLIAKTIYFTHQFAIRYHRTKRRLELAKTQPLRSL